MKFKKTNGLSKTDVKNKIDSTYYCDYPTEPIGGGNPYYRCAHCGVSDPEINGSLYKHMEWCEYRKSKEASHNV